jgi:hypothetical protein
LGESLVSGWVHHNNTVNLVDVPGFGHDVVDCAGVDGLGDGFLLLGLSILLEKLAVG